LPAPAANNFARGSKDIEYFTKLKRRLPDQVAMIELGQLNEAPEKILERLRLAPRGAGPIVVPQLTNRGVVTMSEAAAQAIASCFAPSRGRMTDLYQAAREQCE